MKGENHSLSCLVPWIMPLRPRFRNSTVPSAILYVIVLVARKVDEEGYFKYGTST